MLKTAFCLLWLGGNATAILHNLYVGSFNASAIHHVSFDDEKLTLSLVQSFSAADPHYWIGFDVRSSKYSNRPSADSSSTTRRTYTQLQGQNGRATRLRII